MSVILGIGGYHHDASAALVVDGAITGAVAEERLTRVKHQRGMPCRAAAALLEQAGLQGRDIDEMAVFWSPLRAAAEGAAYRLSRLFHDPLHAAGYIGYELFTNARLGHEVIRFARSLGPTVRVRFVEHHLAHAAAAWLTSGEAEVSILSVDAFGERISTWLGSATDWQHGDRRLGCLGLGRFPHSLGSFYAAVTQYLGFDDLDDFKVMGLAPYGSERLVERFSRIARHDGEGRVRLDLDYFRFQDRPRFRGMVSRRFVEEFGPPRQPGALLEDHHRDVARAAQAALEEALHGLVLHLGSRGNGGPLLCLAGGVALNSVAIGRIRRSARFGGQGFSDLWVQPAAADDGTALGAALLRAQQRGDLEGPQRMAHAFLGPDLSEAECQAALDRAGQPWARPRDIACKAARALASGRIVARAVGRSEWGPRALGHRSILADPRAAGTRDRINARVKHRESFRPFAPAVLEERAAEYFDLPGPSPFMTAVYPARSRAQEQCPAVVHVDGSARVQTVSRTTQPGFATLLRAFERETGVPVLLNTSFNVRGEPIVQGAEDALRCFLSTGIDAMILGPFWVEKSG